MAPAAYWASWADALPMLQERLPVIAQNAVNVLGGDANVDGCLGEVRQRLLAWTDRDSLADLSGRHFRWDQQTPNLVNGHTVGNTTRLPLPSSTSGCPWCLLNRARHIRLISAHNQAVAVPMCFMGVPPDPSSRLNRAYSAC